MNRYHYSQIDLIVILIITLCVITINLPFIQLDVGIKDSLSIFFILIPGYSLLEFIYPLNNFGIFKRLLFGFLLSMGILFMAVILENIIYGSSLVPQSTILIILSIVTIAFVILAFIRRNRNINSIKSAKYLKCQECNGYYKLKEGEHKDEFETCECGGKLQEVDSEIKLKESTKKESKHGYFLSDLNIVYILAILSLIISFNPYLNNSIMLTIIAIPFLVLIPGYSLLAALCPKKGDLESTERMVLSFGISILVAPVIGLILNYTPWGIKLSYILVVLTIFTILVNTLAYIKRYRLKENERFILR